MKVLIQTTVTPVMTAYDSESPKAPKGQSGMGKALYKFLQPVVAVTDNEGNVLYRSGEFQPPYIFYGLLILAGLLIVRKL